MLAKDEFSRELFFFRIGHTKEGYEGEGRWFHGKRAAEMLWKEGIAWDIEGQPNEEMLLLWKALCGPEPECMVTGHSSGGKSTMSAAFAILFWISSPSDTGVLIGSTTLGGLRRRIWSEVRRLFFAIPEQMRLSYGWQIVEHPTPSLQTIKGDMKHGIHGVAIGGATESQALDMLRGFHPHRPLVIFDEFTSISKAILKEVVNIIKGDGKLVGIGNASNIFDMHGQMMEPADGWNSVNVDTGSWKTKRGGLAIHLDGEKADCVIRNIYEHKYLFCVKSVKAVIAAEGHNSPAYWRDVRGFWCPEGIVKSVLSASLIQTHRAQEKAEWGKGKTVMLSGLDPAFEGGDRCVLGFANVGNDIEEKSILEYGETIIIQVNAQDKVPIHYQIARRVKHECEIRGIPPRNFAMDSTGEGGGVASILREEWGVGFLEVEFGRKADNDLCAGVNDARPASEVYGNQVTQLWYSFREAVQFYQIRGMSAELCIEFCRRLYSAQGTPTRIKLESKSDMKARGVRSPDIPDMACVILQLARKRGFLGSIQTKAADRQNNSWSILIEQQREAESQAYSCDGIFALM